MAPPDDPDAARVEGWNQPGGLRIVKDGDITRAHQLGQRARVAQRGLLVPRFLQILDLRAVRCHSVEQVVQLFRGLEKLARALDHEPPLVDACAAVVWDQRRKQLRDAAPAGERPSNTSRTGSVSTRLETARNTPPIWVPGLPSSCNTTATMTARAPEMGTPNTRRLLRSSSMACPRCRVSQR